MGTFTRANQEELEKARELLEDRSPSDLGFVKSLFFGRLRFDKIMPYPEMLPEEAGRLAELQKKLAGFLATAVDPARIDAEERIPEEVVAGLREMGIFGLTVPPQFGGGGYSHRAYCKVLEQIGARDPSVAVLIGAHQSIGLKAILLFGSEEQKRRYLPSLASGEKLAAFCLTEDNAGSDAGNVQTRATLSPDGSTWILNGEKKFATNGALAGLLTVMAKTGVTENGKQRDKVTAFIVTPDMPGCEVVQQNRSKCGLRGTWQARLRFSNVAVPEENVLGEVGKGLRIALSVLDFGRCTLSAGCLGSARTAMQLAIDRAKGRVQFGRPIAQFGLTKAKIAHMAETVFAMESILEMACRLVDRHDEKADIMLETAACKLFCSEGLWQIADDTMQIWGGEGYMRDNGVERLFRDARVNRIVEGATEVMTAFIALVGIKGVGEELREVMDAVHHPVQKFDRLADFAKHEWSDILVGHEFEGLPRELAAEGQLLVKMARALARDVEKACRKFREDIIDMQLVQQRISLSAVDLYAMACVISRLHAMLRVDKDMQGAHTRRDVAIGRSFCQTAAKRVRLRLENLLPDSDRELLAVADLMLGGNAGGNGHAGPS